MRRIKSVDDMCLLDDVLMNVVFDDDTETTEEVLRIIMDIPDLTITYAKAQYSIHKLQNRSIRFDIKAVDSAGTNYDIEVQRNDTGAEEKRARFNASMMDSALLRKGARFKELPRMCVIFITEHDVLKGNRPIYHINRTIREKGNEVFDDDEEIIYVNCEYNSGRRNTDIEKLIHDLKCADPSKMYLPRLARKTSDCKSSRETRDMLSEWVERNYGDQLKREVAIEVRKQTKEVREIAKAELKEAKAELKEAKAELKEAKEDLKKAKLAAKEAA
ncbi:MAG: PD-(D/E)XK nuclease family transposase, partial [Erysipelotrichaceae bacterium]|nr:PD-(D/E)XK nuclease family transposase [Erysipelotrichaceae bacterium]